MSSQSDPTSDLSGQVAIVTGGGRGIGRAIACTLAAAGAAVAVLARSEEQLAETVTLIQAEGGRAQAFPADVTDEQRIRAVVAEVERSLGPVTLLVNNAGSGRAAGPAWLGDADEWWRDIEINLRGPFLCARAVLPGMLERGQGRIVNMGSNVGIRPAPYASAYGCSKAALLRLTDSLAASVAARGVTVFAVSPGWVWTEMTYYALEQLKALMPEFTSIPESDVFPPEAVARLIARIAGGGVDSLTGRYIHVSDPLDEMLADVQRILEQDLYTLRLHE